MSVLLLSQYSWAGSSVQLYNGSHRPTCILPSYVQVEVLDGGEAHSSYLMVRLPSEYQKFCGRIAWVKRNRPQSTEAPDLLDVADEPPARRRQGQAELGEQNTDWDLSVLPVPANGKSYRRSHSADLEAGGDELCVDCLPQTNLDRFSELGTRVYEQSLRPRCEANGYRESFFSGTLRGREREVIGRYTERAQGAIRRALLAIVPSVGTSDYQRLKKLTNNFENFDDVDPMLLRTLLRPSGGDCYKYVKAALSNDYSVLEGYNRRRKNWDKANVNLVRRFCGDDSGDLTEEHWLNSAIGAGTAGRQLEARGFINLMDKKWGVSQKYFSNETAPEGAVLVYKCASRGQILPASKCYGDIAIKTKTGYVRDFFTPYSNTTSGRRVLVGIYIKPEES